MLGYGFNFGDYIVIIKAILHYEVTVTLKNGDIEKGYLSALQDIPIDVIINEPMFCMTDRPDFQAVKMVGINQDTISRIEVSTVFDES